MKRLSLSLIAGMMFLPVLVNAQRLQQPTGRGVVAVNRSGSTIRSNVTGSGGTGNLITWRKLAEEPEGTTYNVYRRTQGASDFSKMNASPLKKTSYKPSSLTNNMEYAVTAISPDGVEGEMSQPFLYKTQPWPNVWLNIDFDDTVIRRNDYRTKFCWPMDTDGDGEYDAVVVDRLFAGAATGEEDTENNASTSHKIQAYRFTGELLWTVDMGPNVNICAGQNDMVVAYDINCDGRCEVMIKSSDGTRFWDKANETWGKYAMGSTQADVDGDGIIDYRNHSTKVPPFYVSVIDGLTGEEIDASELKYAEANDGSDQYGRNTRAKYMSFGYAAMEGHFSICYLDGIRPSLVMECLDRGTDKTHHNYVFTWDYDWTSGTPSNWHHSHTWSRNDKRPWPAEFHMLRVADVDGDGTDEMIQGGYSVNPHTGWFASPGIGHGDRFVLSDIDPDRPGLEVYAIQQSALLGQLLYDARTAERIKEWYLPSVYDVGRGTCLDMDASHKGYEILSYADEFVYDCKGEKTGQTRTGSMYEGCWWDGDLQREWLNSPGGSGWGTNLMVSKVLGDRLAEFSQESDWASHGATGTRPAFMGDIIGDWREEVLLAKQDDNICTGLIGYTTAMPTNYSIYCLQQDPHYRGDCTTRGYYQHPNTGFYLGGDMPMPPLPPVFTADLRWKGSNTPAFYNLGVSLDDGFTSFDMTQDAELTEGKSLMFDIYGNNHSTIYVEKPMNASVIYLMNPRGHDYTIQSTHLWSNEALVTTGTGSLIKSMQGTAFLAGWLRHTGSTIISEGTLRVNGDIAGPVELRARGTLAGSVTLKDTITFEGALNYEGCRLMPGFNEPEGVIKSEKSMTLPGNVYLEVCASWLGTTGSESFPVCGHLEVDGDLTFKNTNYITVNLSGQEGAEFVLAECTGTLTCDVTKLKTRGLEGLNYDLVVKEGKLVLVINETRAPSNDVYWTGGESKIWDYKAKNFVLGAGLDGNATAFVAGDAVIFNDQAAQKSVTLNEMMVTNGVTFDSGTYALSGEGGISGEGDLTINEDAKVTLNLKNSDYTGKTIVNGGTLTVPNFYDGSQKSAIGAATADKGNLQLNGGTLVLSKDNMGTDRQITLTDTATIRVAQANSALSLKGAVSGTGYLIKDGSGQLNFTYGGANNFAGLIVKKGVVAQGDWNATFGRSGSPMLLAGGEVHQIDVNNTSTVPNFNHVVTVQEGTTGKIVGSSRGALNGSVKGKGNLTIVSKYVRCDIGFDFKNFEGTLTASGSQWRLMTGVTDMSKATLKVDAATNIAHYTGGKGDQQAVTLKIGAIEGTATDGVLEGKTTYQIGYLNKDMTFAGLFKGASVKKFGTGTLTLKTPGSTSPIMVNAGTLELKNNTSTAITTGLITVGSKGTITGTAAVQDLTLTKGATTLCELKTSGNTRLTVKGNLKHNGDTILVVVPTTRQLNVGDEITVYNVSGTHSGTFVVKVDDGGVGYEFDSSTLLDDGKLRITSITDISKPTGDFTETDTYDLAGRRIPKHATQPQGVYIRNGRVVTKK